MNPVQTLIQQGKNVLDSSKELNRIAHKKGKQRYSLIENFSANKHSFQIYTNMDASIRDSKEVQNFLSVSQTFNDLFDSARYDLEGEVNVEEVKATYPKVIEAYEEMRAFLESKANV